MKTCLKLLHNTLIIPDFENNMKTLFRYNDRQFSDDCRVNRSGLFEIICINFKSNSQTIPQCTMYHLVFTRNKNLLRYALYDTGEQKCFFKLAYIYFHSRCRTQLSKLIFGTLERNRSRNFVTHAISSLLFPLIIISN